MLNYNKICAPITVNENEWKVAFDYCLRQVDKGIKDFGEQCFPAAGSVDLVYPPIDNTSDWVQGFWTGMLWLAYEMTGDEKYRRIADKHVESFLYRIENDLGTDCHDVGVIYLNSCVAAYKLTGSEKGKKAALLAADRLLKRFHVKGSFFQAWGAMDDEAEHRFIIDCLICMPLLFWATEVSGESKYADAATKHVYTALKYIMREDCSTYHTYLFDMEGQPIKGMTHQGAFDGSTWARGQAWGVFGFPVLNAYIKDPALLEAYHQVTTYYLNHLPEDGIPCWDLSLNNSVSLKDSSSTPIVVCGMLEALKQTDVNAEAYENAIRYMMSGLMYKYTTKGHVSNGILQHATYALPNDNGKGVDECNIWGDYYYMEALVRLLKPDWKPYW